MDPSVYPAVVCAIVDRPRFVGYTSAKKAIDPKTNRAGDVSDPAKWGTLAEAEAWARPRGGHVGIVPLDEVVLDFDGARSGGVFDLWTAGWVEVIGADVDLSVSGTGIHIYPEVEWDDELRHLVAHRKVYKTVSVKQVEVRTGHNASIVRPVWRRATKTRAEQTAALKALLRELVATLLRAEPAADNRAFAKVHQGLAAWSADHGLLRDYATFEVLKAAKRDGPGYLDRFEAERIIVERLGGKLRQARRAAKRRIDSFADSPFCEERPNKDTGRTVLALRSPRALAADFGVELDRCVRVAVEDLLARSPLGAVYLALAAMRDGRDKPRPTSRSVRRAMSGASPATQRRAERGAGVGVVPQYALGCPVGRPVVHTSHGPAHQIANATNTKRAQGRGQPANGRVQTDPRRRYVHDGDGTPSQLRFLGFEEINGVRSGLWETMS